MKKTLLIKIFTYNSIAILFFIIELYSITIKETDVVILEIDVTFTFFSL